MTLAIAMRNLRRHGKRSFLTMVAIALGLGSLILIESILTSLHDGQIGEIAETETGYLRVSRSGYADLMGSATLQHTFDDTPALRGKILETQGIQSLTPILRFGGTFSLPARTSAENQIHPKEKTVPLAFKGVEFQTLRRALPRYAKRLSEGREPISGGETKELLLHGSVAGSLGLGFRRDGSYGPRSPLAPALFTLDSQGLPTGTLIEPVGVFEDTRAGGQNLALIPIRTARSLLGLPGQAHEYAILVSPENRGPEQLRLLQKRLEAKLGASFDVHRWDELAADVRELQAADRVFFWIGTAIFACVGYLAVMNLLVMTVLDRSREIGTMMAFGAPRAFVCGMILIEGFLLGVGGALLGGGTACIIIEVIQAVGFPMPAAGEALPLILHPAIDLGFVGSCSVGALVWTAACALWPAWRATGLKPMEALRAA